MSIIEKALAKLEARLDERPGTRRVPEEKDAAEAAPRKPPSGPKPAAEPASGASPDEPAPTDAERAHTRRFAKLDYERLAASGMITPHTSRSTVAEQFRMIKRPLLLKATPEAPQAVPRGNVVLVTSALPGEGKTFTALNLAISVAMELDRTVLLVDADADRGDVGNVLGIPPEPGLTDYLSGGFEDLSDLLVRTDMPKLTVLPSGTRHAHATELYASEQMQRLLEEFSARYRDRVVIFDSSPLLATSGASVLSHYVGQTVLVVEAVRTPQSALREALVRLDSVDNIGLVLNKSRDRMAAGYGYAYGYGSAYAQKD